MIQVGASAGRDGPVDEKTDTSRSAAVKDAVNAFVAAVNESSRQLADSEERFAAQLLAAVESAGARSERAAEAGAEMARRAEQAAAEARTAARQLMEHQTVMEMLGAQVEDLRLRIDQLGARTEAATRATDEQLTADGMVAAVSAVEAAAESARQAALEARMAAEQANRSLNSANVMLAGARDAGGARPESVSPADALLERLENDYAMLARLVEDLHARVGNLTVASALAPHTNREGSRDLSATRAALDAPGAFYQPGVVRADTPASWPAGGSQGVMPAPSGEHTGADSRALTENGPLVLSGLIQMTLTPVRDSDRLLQLDQALSSLEGVRVIALGDFANEEVVFTVDLAEPVTPDELAAQLGRVAGVPAEVAETRDGAVKLRVA